MRREALSSVVLMAVFLAVAAVPLGCGKAAAKPEIKSLEPESGSPGSEVVIKGGGFGSSQGTGVVFFSGKQVEVVAWSDTVITVKIPVDMAEAAYGVKVETEKGASNEVEFKVTGRASQAPKITSLEPGSGKSGDEVVIKGERFGAAQGNGKVLFGTGTAQVVKWSDTSITIVVPPNLGKNTYGVTVKNDAGKSNEAIFRIGSDEEKFTEQKQAIIDYLKAQGQSTAGSEQWTVTMVKRSSQDSNWEVLKVTAPGNPPFEAVLIMNNMLGGWECLKTGEPPWTGLEFKGEPIPSDIEKV
ncbi:MAG: IPT/TIG domain-containing protein [Actinobacteria bacterium]|nr:IPT/TIG domain-containing protein [Actinomycetota bacterium]